MEQKKEMSWDERHPMGNLRYYTFLDGFNGVESLKETGTKCALRVLKRHLEDHLGFELTDEAFIAIFFRVINLGPARPLGADYEHCVRHMLLSLQQKFKSARLAGQ